MGREAATSGRAGRARLTAHAASATAGLRGALSAFDTAASDATRAVTPEALNAAVATACNEATKVGLVCKGNTIIEEKLSVLQGFEVSALGLISFCHAATVRGGKTHLLAVHSAVAPVIEASVQLVTAAASEEELEGNKLAQLTGRVWETAERLKKLPLDNRTAIGRALIATAALVKDVIREFAEVTSTSQQQHDENQPSSTSSAADEDQDREEELSAEELAVARSIEKLLHAINALYRPVLRAVSTCDGQSSANVALMEEILEAHYRLTAEVDNLGSSVYPPQQPAELQQHAESVHDCIAEIVSLTEKLTSDPPSPRERLSSTGRQALECCDQIVHLPVR
eukprot:jgi/Chlat1/3887/Chrsp26S08858